MIRLIFVGKSKERWLVEQVSEYVKRLGRFLRVEVLEVKDEKIGRDDSVVKGKEGERLLKSVGDDFLVALDASGKSVDSPGLALLLKKWLEPGRNISFVVGGALGLSSEVLDRADFVLSLSKMTFTNQMVRVILAEQVYRAVAINSGVDYHK